MVVRFLFVFDFVLILFRVTWWPAAGKEVSPWLSVRVVFILCRLNCMCSFPVRCPGQDVEFLIIALSSTFNIIL